MLTVRQGHARRPTLRHARAGRLPGRLGVAARSRASDPERRQDARSADGRISAELRSSTTTPPAVASPRRRSSRSSSGRTRASRCTPRPRAAPLIQQTLFGTGDWDIAWIPLNVNSPDQLVRFLSGPACPNGTQLRRASRTPTTTPRVKKASAMAGDGRLRHLARGRVRPLRRGRHRAVRQQPRAHVRSKARVRDARQLVPTSIRMLGGVTPMTASSVTAPTPHVADPSPGSAPTRGSGSPYAGSGGCWSRCGCW